MTTLRDNRPAGRFEWDEGGMTAFADYRRAEGRLILDHVEAPPALRGSGAAGRLMEAITAMARAQGLRIIPICGYAGRWLRTRPEHSDLLG